VFNVLLVNSQLLTALNALTLTNVPLEPTLVTGWQRVLIPSEAILANVIRVQLVMVKAVLILTNAVPSSTIAVTLEYVLILKEALHVHAPPNI